MGAAKAAYNLFKVLALVVALTTAATGVIAIYDGSRVNVVEPSASEIHFSPSVSWFNVSFPITIEYGGSAFVLKNLNLTLIIYPTSNGTGTPLFPPNSTIFDLLPGQNKEINYSFSLASPPVISKLSIKVIAKGEMVLASLTFIDYSATMVYDIM